MAVLVRHKSTIFGLVTDLAQLQTNIDNEANTRGAADTTLQGNIDAEATARSNADTTLQGNIDAEATARGNADTALTGRVNNINSATGISGDTYTAPVSSNFLGSTTSLAAADLALDAAIKTNVDGLSTEATARANADTALQQNIDSEATTRANADNALDSRLDVIEGDSSTIGSVAKAEADAKAHAQAILTAFEEGDFQALENLVGTINGASTVDGSFRKAIADVVNSAPEALDTLNEIATYIAVDGSGDNVLSAITNSVTAAKEEIRGEVSGAYDTLAEVEDALDILNGADTVAGSVAKAVKDASDAVTAEAASRVAADTTLQGNIDSEAATRAAADLTLQGNIDTEAATRSAADTTLQGNINAEATARATADTTLQDNIDAEELARTTADTTLTNGLADLSGVTDAATARSNLGILSTTETRTEIASGGANFITEVITVSGDTIVLAHAPKNGVILNFGTVRHTDANYVSYDIPVTVGVTTKTFNLSPNASGDFDGKTVVVQYAYTPAA